MYCHDLHHQNLHIFQIMIFVWMSEYELKRLLSYLNDEQWITIYYFILRHDYPRKAFISNPQQYKTKLLEHINYI